MILTFTQSSDQSFGGVPAYEAEFEVTSNFAIHIERTRGDAALILKQRTGGGKYALVDDFNYAKSKGEVLDYEASVTIPKYIKIVSEVEPTLAEIVTDGEVTEIKAQAKEIEVTTNGTTEVIPDSGFAYLSKVNIKTNVPTAGGGEGIGSTGGGNDMVYVDFSQMDSRAIPVFIQFATDAVYSPVGSDTLFYGPAAPAALLAQNYPEKVKRASFNRSQPFYWPGTEFGTCKNIGEVLELMGFTSEDAGEYFITEEEFYNLNA